MKNPICISTGFLYRLTNDRNEIINKTREFSPDGIELSFAHPQYLFDFIIDKENLKYLKSLQFISIHSPWKEISYGNNQTCKDILEVIEKLYKQVGAENVVFHVEKIEDINILKEYDFIASIENKDWRYDSVNTVEQIEAILNKNKSLKFTFDFAHALTVSPNDIPKYITKLKDRLIAIHLSMLNKQLKDHWFLHKYDSKQMRNLLNCLKDINVPIVLECVASDWSEVPLIKKEIEYIKSI